MKEMWPRGLKDQCEVGMQAGSCREDKLERRSSFFWTLREIDVGLKWSPAFVKFPMGHRSESIDNAAKRSSSPTASLRSLRADESYILPYLCWDIYCPSSRLGASIFTSCMFLAQYLRRFKNHLGE